MESYASDPTGNSTRSSLKERLMAYLPADEKEAADREAMVGWLGRLPHPFSPEQPEAHFTASAVVVDPSGNHVCLVRHRHLDRWLQPGGHPEGSDENLGQTALREAREETALQLEFHPLARRPFDVDVHLFPERDGFPAHHHLDLRFLLIAQDPEELVHQAEEAHDARWFTWLDALSLSSESAMERMLTKARKVSEGASENTG